MAEDLTDYLNELGVKVQYLHSEVDTLERVAILRDLRLGVFDVLVGINLLREGIDLPEVTLVAILDADKEGFLRSAWSLIQMIGRAARNIGGEVVMYADHDHRIDAGRDRRDGPPARDPGARTTASTASSRRRSSRASATSTSGCAPSPSRRVVYTSERGGELTDADRAKVEALVARMEAEMKAAAKELEFERAAALRDEIQQIRLRVLEQDASIIVGRAAERAASRRARGLTGAADRARGRRGERRPRRSRPGDGGHERRRSCRPTRSRRRRPTASPGSTRTPSPDWLPGHPRRARGRRRLAGALARPPDLGPHGHAEHPQAHGPAPGAPPLVDAKSARGRAGCPQSVRSSAVMVRSGGLA